MIRRLSLLMVAVLLLTTGFSQAADNVATVNSDPISVTLFQQRVRFARWTTAQQLDQIVQQYGAQALSDTNSPYRAQFTAVSDASGFAKQVLDGLITVKLVQQEAAARGLTVSDAEVQASVYTFFGYDPNATPLPPPTPQPGQTAVPPLTADQIAQVFQQSRDNYFAQAGGAAHMSQDDILSTFREQALQIKLFDVITATVPSQAEQSKVAHILVDSQDKANAILNQLQSGASFADLAKQNSSDTSSKDQGGDLGWAPRGTYADTFESAVWNSQPGTIIGPVKTPFGYHVILVEARELHPLSDTDMIRARQVAYNGWLQQARSKAAITIVDNWQSFIPPDPTLKDLGLPDVK